MFTKILFAVGFAKTTHNPNAQGKKSLQTGFQSILYDSPLTPNNANVEIHEGEQIILHNVSKKAISLQGWKVENVGTAESYTFAENASIEADSSFILDYGLDSFYLTLSDIGANLRIVRPDGEVIDEVIYEGDIAANDFEQSSSLNVLQRVYYTQTAGRENLQSYRAAPFDGDLELLPYSIVYEGIRHLGDKVYELKDHLGNVRVTVTDVRMATIDAAGLSDFRPEVMSMSDYYAFGMLMVGRNWQAGGYRYGFQGQEMDNEVEGTGNSINYSYRVHDPRLGRFLSIDPLAPKYAYNSPYAFSENRVVDGVELEGLEFFVGTIPPWMILSNNSTIIRPITEITTKTETVEEMGMPRWDTQLSNTENYSNMKEIGRTVEAERFPNWEEEGFTTEHWLGKTVNNNGKVKGNRVDGIRLEGTKGYLRELKPNTPTGIKNGIRALNRYVKAAQKMYPEIKEWIPELELYYSFYSVSYDVTKGDNLSSIATKFGTTVKTICELNEISNPNFITEGQTLIVNILVEKKATPTYQEYSPQPDATSHKVNTDKAVPQSNPTPITTDYD